MNNILSFSDFISNIENLTEDDLRKAENLGIIIPNNVQEEMNKQEKQKILDNHPYAVTQGTGEDKRWKTYLPCKDRPSGRKPVAKTYLSDLENCVIEYYEKRTSKKNLDNLTLKTFYPIWLKHKSSRTKAENYIERIDDDWNKYYLDTDIIDIQIKKLDKLTLDNWAHDLIKKYSLTKKQYYNLTIIMRQGLEYAIELGMIKESPFAEVEIDGKVMFTKVHKKPNVTQVFFPHEVEQIVTLAWDDFEKYHNRFKHKFAPLAVLFQFETGVRIGELCALHDEDLIYNSSNELKAIHIQRMLRYTTDEIVDPKSDCSNRTIPLTPNAIAIIETIMRYKKEHGITTTGFIFSINEHHIPMDSISNLYVKYCKKIDTILKGSHKARKTFISALLHNQVNLDTVRILAGHEDERTTLGSYCYDLNSEDENRALMAKALNYQRAS